MNMMFVKMSILALCISAVMAQMVYAEEGLVLAQTEALLPSKDDRLQSPPQTETLKQLSWHITWRRLLLLPDTQKQGALYEQSAVHHQNFFVSEGVDKGRVDAYQEMVALVNALEDEQMYQHMACRFPARIHWLQSQGVINKEVVCPDFEAWAAQMNVQQLSMMFAEEHPDLLSSAFAHTLLKAETKTSLDTGSDTDALAINYTVSSNQEDGAIKGIVKSIAGKYAGVMEIKPFDEMDVFYRQKHKRDMWQYVLELDEAQIAQMIRHIWEVKDMARSYYFTHDNCSTEIVRLIDVVRPDLALLAQSGNITIPSEIARVLTNANLVRQTHFLPSEATVRQALINQGQPKTDVPTALIPSHNNPATANESHRIGVGVGHHNAHGTLWGVSVSSAYQDMLDRPSGVRQYLQMQLPSVQLQVDEDKLKITQATLFSTRSYNPVNTAKAYRSMSTGMHLGLRQVTDGADRQQGDHLVWHTSLERGRAWTIGQGQAGTGELSDMLCYTFAEGMAQVGRIQKGYRLGVGANVGCAYRATEEVRMIGEVRFPYWYQGKSDGHHRGSYWQPNAMLGVQYDITKNHALRLTAEYEQLPSEDNKRWVVQYLRYF